MVCTYCGAHRNESDKTCSVCGADFTQLNMTKNSQSTNTSVDGFIFDNLFGDDEKGDELLNADNFLNMDEIKILDKLSVESTNNPVKSANVEDEKITTFDDLFGKEEITTFDDLFGQDTAKNDEEITTFEDLFGKDDVKSEEEVVAFEDLFGKTPSQPEEETVAFEDLFENSKVEEVEQPKAKSFDVSLDDIQDMLIEQAEESKTEHDVVKEQHNVVEDVDSSEVAHLLDELTEDGIADERFDVSLDELDSIQDMLLGQVKESKTEHQIVEDVDDLEVDHLLDELIKDEITDEGFDVSLDELDSIQDMLTSKEQHPVIEDVEDFEFDGLEVEDFEEESKEKSTMGKGFDVSLDELDDIQDMLIEQAEESKHKGVEDVDNFEIEHILKQPEAKGFDVSLDELDNIQDMLTSKGQHSVAEEQHNIVEDVEDFDFDGIEVESFEEESKEKSTMGKGFDVSLDELDDIQDMLIEQAEESKHKVVEDVDNFEIEHILKQPEAKGFDVSLDELDNIQDMLTSKGQHSVAEEQHNIVEDVEDFDFDDIEVEYFEEKPKAEETKAKEFDLSLDDLDNIQDMLTSKGQQSVVEEQHSVTEEKHPIVEDVEDFDFDGIEVEDFEEESKEEETKAKDFDLSLDDLDNIQDMLTSKGQHSVTEEKHNVAEEQHNIVEDVEDFDFDGIEVESFEQELTEEGVTEEGFDVSLDELDNIQDMLISKTENIDETPIVEINVVEPNIEDFVDVDDIDDDFFDIDDSELEQDLPIKRSKKKKKDTTFDFSLDDLEDIEKSLTGDDSKADDTLSYLEQALINGEDISDFDVKEALTGDDENDDIVEFFDEEEIEEIANIRKVKSFSGFNVDFDLFEKVRDGLILKAKGEPIPFATVSEDSRTDDEILKEVQATVTMLMNNQVADNNISDELLELEQMLLSHTDEVKERSDYVVEEVEDHDLDDFEDFVEADDIDDDDNVLIPTRDDEIQGEIDNLLKSFQENAKDGIITESKNIMDVLDKDRESRGDEDLDQDESDTDADEFDLIEKQILTEKSDNDNLEQDDLNLDELDSGEASINALDSLISEIVGELPEEEEFLEEEEEESIYKIKTVDNRKYDEELVREYEALRLDLELFFPGTQDLDNLSRDIDLLLSDGELDELSSSTGINFDGVDLDLEELTDKDITDALLDMRDIKEKEANAKKIERMENRKRRREKVMYYLTLGNRVRVYDTLLICVFIVTAVVVINAWLALERNNNTAVNVQSRNEQIDNAEELWDGIYDIATGFIEIQLDLVNYNSGKVPAEKMTFELISYIDKSVQVREKFENVGLPTYSEYKYKIDEFLAMRMLIAEQVLEDIQQGRSNTHAMQELLNMETDIKNFDNLKQDFFDKLNLD